MKISTFIFAVYLLLLSTVPCCVFDKCNSDLKQASATHKHLPDDNCKNCSPFALCGNCCGFTFAANTFQFIAPQQQSLQIFVAYNQSYFPAYVSSFWQPPRLS